MDILVHVPVPVIVSDVVRVFVRMNVPMMMGMAGRRVVSMMMGMAGRMIMAVRMVMFIGAMMQPLGRPWATWVLAEDE